MTELSDLLAACDALAADTNAAGTTRTVGAKLRAWAPTVTPAAPAPVPAPVPTPAPVLGSKLAAFLPRKVRPNVTPQLVALGANLANLVNAIPLAGGVIVQLQGGAWGPQVLPSRAFVLPVWFEKVPGDPTPITFTNPNGHGLYSGGIHNVVLADMVAKGSSNTGVKLDTNTGDVELIRVSVIGNANQGMLCAAHTSRIALWDCYGEGNGHTSTSQNQSHNFYVGECDTLLIANLLSTHAQFGSCLQIGGAVRHWRVVNPTLDFASSPNGACVDLYTMSTQTPPNQDGLLVNPLLTRSGYYGMIGSGTDTYAASQVVSHALSWGHKTGDFAGVGTQYELGAGIIKGQDPLYVDMANGDLHLQAGSPARGVGDPDWTPTHDREGRARTDATLGAYA